MLAAAWALPLPLFLLPSEPVAPGLEPFLVRHQSGSWSVNRERSAADVYGTELDEGDWSMLLLALQAGRFPTRSRLLPKHCSRSWPRSKSHCSSTRSMMTRSGASRWQVPYQCKSGMLDATMGELGIQVGKTWTDPLVAVLGREGEVGVAGHAVKDWEEVEGAALAVARVDEGAP